MRRILVNRPQVYKEDSGIHLMCIGKGHGAGDGQLDLPMGISIDTTKRLIYVCECGNRRVSVFSCENYSFRSKFGSSGEFMKPEVCADSINFARDE